MKSIILTSILLGCLSFLSHRDKNEDIYKVTEYNSSDIKINGKPIKPGMKFSQNAKITFSNNKQEFTVQALETHNYRCTTHKCTETWKYGAKRKFVKSGSPSSANMTWWLINHQTISKGIFDLRDSAQVSIVGDSRCFEIDNIIVPEANEYYEFIITHGKYKGYSFRADRDDEVPVIWIDRNNFPADEDSFIVMIKHNHYYTSDTICNYLHVNLYH